MLLSFIFSQKDRPPQGSKEWLEQRMHTFGGSEAAVLMGVGKFSNKKQLFKDKLHGSSFKGSLQTRWGKLFEPICRRMCEIQYNCNIYETGSILGPHPAQSFSPDGIAHIDNSYILFEFKSPYSRIPDGVVPSYYMPQIQAGFVSLPWCSGGIFVESVFRRCSSDNLDWSNNYDKILHTKDPQFDNPPVCCGIVGFIGDLDGVFKCKIPTNATSYSSLSATDMSSLLWLIDKAIIFPVYTDPIFNGDEIDSNNILASIQQHAANNNMIVYGYLPYKCLLQQVKKITPDMEFKDKYEISLDDAVAELNALK